MRLLSTALLLLLQVCFNAFAMENGYTSAAWLSISGAVEFDIAEYVKMRNYQGMTSAPGASTTLNRVWFGHNIGILRLESLPLDYLKVRAAFEFNQYMTTRPTIDGASPNKSFGQSYWNGFYIREGQGIFTLFDKDQVHLDCAIGYFPYKYNNEVRNLGEFLFRSGTYPLYLLGEFDRPFARQTGIRIGFEYTGDEAITSKADLLGLLERSIPPFNTLSFASVASVNIMKIIDIGAGVEFAHAVPINDKFTKVRIDDNRYIKDSVLIDVYDSSTSPPTLLYTNKEYEYGYYDFKGTKLMVRATVDPFVRFRDQGTIFSDILGIDGFKLYGEYAVIGTKNYPEAAQAPSFPTYKRSGYTDVKERSPWMVGVNIPAWKLLDVCAFELERFPSYYADDYYSISCHGLPHPAQLQGETYDSTTFVPRWNWSLYLKKNVTDNVAIIAQLARDHQRAERHPGAMQYNDYGAATVKPDEWGWHMCARFHF